MIYIYMIYIYILNMINIIKTKKILDIKYMI